MIKCIDCRRYVNGTCYLKAIKYQDYHVKETDSCKNGIEKPKKITGTPISTKSPEKAAIPTNQSLNNQQAKEDKQ